MPAKRKIQDIETPESHVPEIEVRWLASAPAYPHKPYEIVKLPDDAELKEFRRTGWVEEVQ